MRSRLLALTILLQAVLVLFLCAWALGLLRPIGVPGQWAWVPTGAAPFVGPLLVAVGALLAVTLASAFLWTRSWTTDNAARLRGLGMAWRALLVLGAAAWPLLLYAATPTGWRTLTLSAAQDLSCEYFGDAYELRDPFAYCVNYAERQKTSAHHIATHPPGATLAYWAAIRVSQASGLSRLARPVVTSWSGESAYAVARETKTLTGLSLSIADVGLPLAVAAVFSLVAALTVLPAAACGRMLWGEQGAFPAAALTATLPGLAIHFQNLDAPLALVLTTAVWMALRGLTNSYWSLAAGALLGLGTFITFGMSLGVAVSGLVLLLGRTSAEDQGLPWARPPRLLRVAGLVAGLAVMWVLFIAVLGQDPLALAANASEAHHGVIEGFGRVYHVWVWMNLLEFGSFLGPALAVLALVGAWFGVRGGGEARAVALAVLGTLLLVDLSGTVRAEVGRIWAPLMPAFAILAAGAWHTDRETNDPGPARGAFALTLLLQCVTLVALSVALQPVVRPY